MSTSPGRPAKRNTPPTPGGRKRHDLRAAARKSLLHLEGDLQDRGYDIGAAHIGGIERGEIERPSSRTLNSVLECLNASYRDRRAVLEAFGYKVPSTLPSQEEIEEARRLLAHEIEGATWPIYLVDYGHRLLAWNRYMPRLIGRDPDDPALKDFVGITVIDLLFNPAYPMHAQIRNFEQFVPMVLSFIKNAAQPLQDEPWFIALMERHRALPGFSELWDRLPEDASKWMNSQPIIPVELAVPCAEASLEFRLSTAEFVLDPRFQLIHYNPYGAATMRQLAFWAEEEGVM